MASFEMYSTGFMALPSQLCSQTEFFNVKYAKPMTRPMLTSTHAPMKSAVGTSRGATILSVARSEVVPPTADERTQLNNMGGIVTDQSVPEGHKGLHGFLYGEAGADVHDSVDETYLIKDGEDDGTTIIKFDDYVSAREGKKFAGVYAVYDASTRLQYIGYSRNVILSLKGHRLALGETACASVRVQLYSGAALLTRQRLDEQRQLWLDESDSVPPGNGADLNLWEGPNGPGTAAMSAADLAAYEEKKLKMRKAMGENLFDDVEGETMDSKERRLRLLKATEGDDWSAVIDGQTRETVVIESASSKTQTDVVSPFARPGGPVFSPDAGEGSKQPLEMTMAAVDDALNEVRPYLIADGGNVEVVAVEKGVVMLRLKGACGTCPSSTSTMKMGIERALQNKFGDLLKEVMQVDKQDIGASLESVDSFLDSLRPAVRNFKGKVSVVSVDRIRSLCEIKYEGPPPVGMGIQAAIKDKFPDIRTVTLV